MIDFDFVTNTGTMQIPLMNGPKPFEFKVDDTNCATEWRNWLRGFEIFAKANKIEDNETKRDWLLHFAGLQVQNIYFNLPQEPEVEIEQRCGPLAAGYVPFTKDPYSNTVIKLESFFAPKQNISYERHVFRKMKQEKTERIDSFVMRLRIQANKCEFYEKLDDNIKDQITSGCECDKLRRKILERDDNVTLDAVLKIARIGEAVREQQKEFTNKSKLKEDTSETTAEVCEITNRKSFNNRRNTNANQNGKFNQNIDCGRCGLKGHKQFDQKCPAKGKECAKCGKMDHFARKCLTKSFNFRKRNQTGNDNDSSATKVKREEKQENNAIQLVEHDQFDKYDDYEDVFCDTTPSDANKIWCKVGGIEIKVVVDSGTRYNIVDRETWTELKGKNVQTLNRQKEVDIGFMAYGGHSLKFLGMFEAVIQVANNKQMVAKFYVANEFGKFLLGFETAIALDVLKIGSSVNNIEETKTFNKIKGIIIEIPIKGNAKAVQQPYRRIPVPLEKIVDEKVSDLYEKGIIEKVKVSKWISPLVVVPKGKDTRICVDMRRANEAVARENHPLPTIEDILPELGTATVFSKLDVKSAFHQVEF